jgi:hypothetical protein
VSKAEKNEIQIETVTYKAQCTSKEIIRYTSTINRDTNKTVVINKKKKFAVKYLRT